MSESMSLYQRIGWIYLSENLSKLKTFHQQNLSLAKTQNCPKRDYFYENLLSFVTCAWKREGVRIENVMFLVSFQISTKL